MTVYKEKKRRKATVGRLSHTGPCHASLSCSPVLSVHQLSVAGVIAHKLLSSLIVDTDMLFAKTYMV